ncbi:MAG: Asp-tRNA(Asn)/Glu-tRNA(Gln) amidotransferase subunit GatB [Deltaproteobacteria bacterium]|jgi:aspartyl-tRNA(Asn)/glutamyl-tRNA(Gln) amidotransferase subunit B|nr:Asp-tRNA(Asn)/Glu-tRNA(Gln) amidotransferase subunit GatB [Deltaproteobacteria bacterium]
MVEMEPVIGLEIHAQLKTKTKLFCSCLVDFGAQPNTHICEICSGQPGALPRMNAKALELAAKAGVALGCKVNNRSVFSRKNYFYPDLPNGFQTSQLDPPICQGGELSIAGPDGPKTIHLNRIHLEDDAGKCIHDEKRGRTLIDLNRAGVPLIEIVTEPELNSSTEAVEFLKKLHGLLVRLEVTMGRMEEGEFRCDVNISLKPKGSDKLGVRSEIKNLNSFRYVGQAIDFEIKRQTALYESGQGVLQQTLHFDTARGETKTLRSKEEAHDYRYFPQPDLPVVTVDEQLIRELQAGLPETPEQSLEKLAALGIRDEVAKLLIDRRGALEYFEQALLNFNEPKRLSTLMTELLLPACQKDAIAPTESLLTPKLFAQLAKLIEEGTLGRRAAYELFPELFQSGLDPKELAQKKGVLQISDSSALEALAAQIIAQHPKEADKYRQGQDKILGFLVGQLMRSSRGAADPKRAGEALEAALKAQS